MAPAEQAGEPAAPLRCRGSASTVLLPVRRELCAALPAPQLPGQLPSAGDPPSAGRVEGEYRRHTPGAASELPSQLLWRTDPNRGELGTVCHCKVVSPPSQEAFKGPFAVFRCCLIPRPGRVGRVLSPQTSHPQLREWMGRGSPTGMLGYLQASLPFSEPPFSTQLSFVPRPRE